MKKLALTAIALTLAFVPNRAHARFVFTLQQAGANVVINGSGSLNTTALTLLSSTSIAANIVSGAGQLIAGPATPTNYTAYTGGNLSGPAAFGSGNSYIYASSGTGSIVGVYAGYPDIFVPQGYVSGTLLTDSSTYNNQTFASLGFTPGTYTYGWGSGATADSIVITSVVPEPSTWALLCVGATWLGYLALRRRTT